MSRDVNWARLALDPRNSPRGDAVAIIERGERERERERKREKCPLLRKGE
jgi:hypothetical protein